MQGFEPIRKDTENYDKSAHDLPRHFNEVMWESAAVWAKIGETLAVCIVGYYGLDY